MTRVNLIPRERILQRQRRARVRLWSTVGAAYALFLLVATVVSHVVRGDDDRTLQHDLVEARRLVVTAGDAIDLLQEDLATAAAALGASRMVGDQPDWSVLLALLAETKGPDIMLRECRMRTTRPPRTRQTAEKDAAGAEPIVSIEISGLAAGQGDVSDLLLRVEAIPLFRDVHLQDSRREPFLDRHAIAFRLDFTLDPDPEETP